MCYKYIITFKAKKKITLLFIAMALLRSSQRELLLYLYEAESFKSSLFLIMFDIELLRD